MSRKLLKTTEKMSREDAAEKLHSLADKIGEGQVELKSGNDSVSLQPGKHVEFELDVEEEEDGDISIEIEVEWPEAGNGENLEIQ
jgi:amphi-Trp domain-containing protein